MQQKKRSKEEKLENRTKLARMVKAKELKDRTLASMQDCINALLECNDDTEEALDYIIKHSCARYGIPL